MKKITAKDRTHLQQLIEKEMNTKGNGCNLNHIDISLINDLSYFFGNSEFNGNISKWNTSHVIDMKHMFEKSEFNGDISKWDVSKVEDMTFMFYDASFDKDLSSWKPLGLKYATYIFKNCPAPVPFWAQDIKNIPKVIASHELNDKLQDLEKKDKNKIKIKI